MRTGVLGGTFDPPHLAHLVLAAAARRALALDRVLFVPAGEPWRKAGWAVSPPQARVRMVRAAVAPFAWAEVSTVEVQRTGPSYSAETLEHLANAGGAWWFILGSDALEDLPHWHEPQRLVAAARLAVATRAAADGAAGEALRRAVAGIAARIDAVPMPPLDVSATDLRERVRDGRATAVLLPEPVREVVDALALYREG